MLKAPLALLPVLGFLLALVVMDSFKLVPLRAVLRAILAGAAAAVVCIYANGWLLDALAMPVQTFSRLLAPAVEELVKGLYVVYLLRRQRIGFLVDAAIYGFAVGAGFALVENVDYLLALRQAPILLWVVRGLGTALLHGGASAILAILAKGIADRHPRLGLLSIVPGWASAVAVHSLFNNLILVLSPLATTAILLVALPLLLVLVFSRSESATREWLGVGFDTDIELLKLLASGGASQTRIGSYLRSLRDRFDGLVVADMSCLLRVQLELSVRAKGLLMAREAGVEMPVGDDVRSAFQELRYLERSIGRTGLLALHVVLTRTSRDLWELYLLEQASRGEARGAGRC